MTSASYVSEGLLVVWTLLIMTVVATFLIQRHKITAVPPSVAAMAIGIVVGIVVTIAGLSRTLYFSPAAFFYGLLPPIVFMAGFTLKKREFFRHVGTISMFAVVGTIISTITFGLLTYLLVLLRVVKRKHLGTAPLIECMLYGALISATDPVATLSMFSAMDVPPLLYHVVFGESVLNDAVAIVLFRTLEEFYKTSLTWAALPLIISRFVIILCGSIAVGILVALSCAFILKRFEAVPAGLGSGSGDRASRHHTAPFIGTTYEISLVVMSAYLAYLVAEVMSLSGIVALFFTGICHAHYSLYSVTPQAQITLRRFFEVAAFLCETFVFAYLGLQVATLWSKTVDWGLMLTGLPFILLTRAANIFPLSQLLNKRLAVPLPFKLQVMIWAVGLRGAVAYGLAVNLPQIDAESDEGIPAIETATLVVVVLSTLLFGGATGPLLRFLQLHGVDDDELGAMGYAEMHDASPTSAMERVRQVSERDSEDLWRVWRELDKRYLKPVFGGRGPTLEGHRSFGLLSHDSEDYGCGGPLAGYEGVRGFSNDLEQPLGGDQPRPREHLNGDPAGGSPPRYVSPDPFPPRGSRPQSPLEVPTASGGLEKRPDV